MPTKDSGIMSVRLQNDMKNDLESMLKMSGTTLTKVVIDLYRKWSDGKIDVVGGKIIIPESKGSNDTGYDFGKFTDACNMKGIKVQDAIDKATQMIWRS